MGKLLKVGRNVGPTPLALFDSGASQPEEAKTFETAKYPNQSFPEWAQRAFEALNHPLMALILLLVGFTAAFVEANTPGLGVPGFVALVSFALFFWSTFLGGTSTWLEAILFALGVLCLILEAFVIPGFGIFGIGGWVMILLALVLARAHEQWPPTPETVRSIFHAAILICVAFTGAILLAAGIVTLLGRWGLGGLVLPPPQDANGQAVAQANSYKGVSVGDIGEVVTPLRLAGKVRFPAGVLDVTSTDLPVDPGRKVRVTEIRGHLVYVEPVDPEK